MRTWSNPVCSGVCHLLIWRSGLTTMRFFVLCHQSTNRLMRFNMTVQSLNHWEQRVSRDDDSWYEYVWDCWNVEMRSWMAWSSIVGNSDHWCLSTGCGVNFLPMAQHSALDGWSDAGNGACILAPSSTTHIPIGGWDVSPMGLELHIQPKPHSRHLPNSAFQITSGSMPWSVRHYTSACCRFTVYLVISCSRACISFYLYVSDRLQNNDLTRYLNLSSWHSSLS